MRLNDPAIRTLIDTIREEGIDSKLLSYSAIQLYRQYTPLQVYSLELTTKPPSRDYTSFNQFWNRLTKKILKEFESVRLAAMSEYTHLPIPPSPIIRTARTQYTEDDFRQVEGEIGNGGNAQSIAKALMLTNIGLFMEDYETEVENLRLTLNMSGRLQVKAFKVLENLKSETNSVKEVVSKLQKRADNRWLVEGHAIEEQQHDIEEQQRRLDERKKHLVMIKQGQSDGIKMIKEMGEKLDATVIEMDMLAGTPNSTAYAHLPIEYHKDVVTPIGIETQNPRLAISSHNDPKTAFSGLLLPQNPTTFIFGANVPSPAATNFDGSVTRQKRKTSEDHDQGKRMRF